MNYQSKDSFYTGNIGLYLSRQVLEGINRQYCAKNCIMSTREEWGSPDNGKSVLFVNLEYICGKKSVHESAFHH